MLSCNFLEHHRLKIGLTHYFKKFRLTGLAPKPIQPTVIGFLNKKLKGTKLFYEVLQKKSVENNPNECQSKWSKLILNDASSEEWGKIFSVCFETISDNEIIWFQYRILHKILGTKNMLFKMSITETNLCRNCGLVEETIEHIFFRCVKVQEFLPKIYTLLESVTGIKYYFTIQEVLLGVTKHSNQSMALNIVLLLLKKYIFEMTQKGAVLNITAFSNKLNRIYTEHEYLANINLQIPKFRRKWAFIKDLIHTNPVDIKKE